jgi:MFS superfamily sulfate permease-like transporter
MMKLVKVNDLSASLVVFLVALPLCLGIALASEAPLMSGIITGVVGGIVVGLLSGSQLSVSGPAAGLTIIVSGQIAILGSFEKFLVVVMLAGLAQLLLSTLRSGHLAGVFPSSVIQGMLAAIGIIIILKQIPHALGRDLDFEGSFFFKSFTGSANTFSEIVSAVSSFETGAIIISLVSVIILFSWDRLQKFNKNFMYLPGPLFIVVLGVVLNSVFAALKPEWALSEAHLVQIPLNADALSLFKELKFPDFSALNDTRVYSMALVLAAVASIETLLCVEATDRLDPLRRFSNPDRELFAQGIGNIVAALLGGLPMTSVIVRSSANIYAGAKTRISTVLHGVWLLLAILLMPQLLNKIPLSSLAAVLFVVGYKLTTIGLYKKFYRQGYDQFLPFAITVIAIMFTDLLTGVGIGFVVGVIMALRRSHASAITVFKEDNTLLIKFIKDVSFINKLKLKGILSEIPDKSKVWIDGGRAMFIDHDIMDILEEFKQSAKYRDISVEVTNVEGKQYPPVMRHLKIGNQA